MTSQTRPFVFEDLPTKARLRIYRELLIQIHHLSDEITEIDPVFESESVYLHPGILRTNKKIHTEASKVLYGENIWFWSIHGLHTQKLWHFMDHKETQIARRYSRLITHLFLDINFKGDDGDPSISAVYKAFDITKANVDNAATKLRLNDLKVLNVEFTNSYTGGPTMGFSGRFGNKPYVGTNCLEALKKVRAAKVSYPACILTAQREN